MVIIFFVINRTRLKHGNRRIYRDEKPTVQDKLESKKELFEKIKEQIPKSEQITSVVSNPCNINSKKNNNNEDTTKTKELLKKEKDRNNNLNSKLLKESKKVERYLNQINTQNESIDTLTKEINRKDSKIENIIRMIEEKEIIINSLEEDNIRLSESVKYNKKKYINSKEHIKACKKNIDKKIDKKIRDNNKMFLEEIRDVKEKYNKLLIKYNNLISDYNKVKKDSNIVSSDTFMDIKNFVMGVIISPCQFKALEGEVHTVTKPFDIPIGSPCSVYFYEDKYIVNTIYSTQISKTAIPRSDKKIIRRFVVTNKVAANYKDFENKYSVLIIGSKYKNIYLDMMKTLGVRASWYNPYEDNARMLGLIKRRYDFVLMCKNHIPHIVYSQIPVGGNVFVLHKDGLNNLSMKINYLINNKGGD